LKNIGFCRGLELGILGLITLTTTGIFSYNIVKSGGPTSISQYNLPTISRLEPDENNGVVKP
jgi:hypothetical protein